MFILATLVNWRFSKQRMKRDASLNIHQQLIVAKSKYMEIFSEANNRAVAICSDKNKMRVCQIETHLTER